MRRYRIVQDGNCFYPQFRWLIWWVPIRGFASIARYAASIEGAREIVDQDIAYENRARGIVWESRPLAAPITYYHPDQIVRPPNQSSGAKPGKTAKRKKLPRKP